MTVHPAKTRISLGIRPVWSESSLSARRKLGSVATYWTHSKDSDQPGHPQRLWSDWVDAQADLSLRLAHSNFVDFDMTRLICPFSHLQILGQQPHSEQCNSSILLFPTDQLTGKMLWAGTWQNPTKSHEYQGYVSGQPAHLCCLIRVFAVLLKKLWVLSYP